MADIDSNCESDKDQNYSTVDADDETLEKGLMLQKNISIFVRSIQNKKIQ